MLFVCMSTITCGAQESQSNAATSTTSGSQTSVDTTVWARSGGGSSLSQFSGITTDSSGSIYVAGFQLGTTAYTYGTQTATGTGSAYNIALVKYDTSGAATWARSGGGTGSSSFRAVATDASDNVYAAGSQDYNISYTYGTQSVSGSNTSGSNVLLIKYDTNGNALWARSGGSPTAGSAYKAVATDSSGNIYAAGYQDVNTTFTYGGQTATATGGGNSVLLVKYDTNGNVLWARTGGGTNTSYYSGVAVDSSGNIYAAGLQGFGSFTYGTQSVSGGGSQGNILLVKYDSSGNVLWARSCSTAATGGNMNEFTSVSVSSSGDIYAVGFQSGSITYTYGSQTVAGTNGIGTSNALVVKYDSSGNVIWARVGTGADASRFNGISARGSTGVTAVGYQNRTLTYTYGSLTSKGRYLSGVNPVIVKYDSNGSAISAQSGGGSNYSNFLAVTTDSSGNSLTAGYLYGTSVFQFGAQAISGTAATFQNPMILKYQ